MRSIRISDAAYDFLKTLAIANHRSVVSTLDRFVSIYKEGTENVGLEEECLSQGGKKPTTNGKMDKTKNKGI